MPMPRKKNKNPPVFSHEFVIQNHADIVSCVAILLMLGLMFELSSPLCRLFVFMQYGVTEEKGENADDEDAVEKFPTDFGRGWLDGFTVFFQALIIIVIHAVIQEYGIDKMSKKLHLSKTKTSKFSESGQLSVWSAVSTAWAGYCIYQAKTLQNIPSLWEDYPHVALPWETKLFMLAQMAYWVHMFPELYLQKVRKEEISARVQYFCLYFLFIFVAYAFHFWRFCVVALLLHYSMECVFHVSRMFYFAEKNEKAQLGFQVWTIFYPVMRFLSLSLTVLVFWFGLRNSQAQGLDIANGNFNSGGVRMLCIAGMSLMQMWLLWRFIQLRSRRSKEQKQVAASLTKKKPAAKPKTGKGKQKKSADSEDDGKVSNGKVKRS